MGQHASFQNGRCGDDSAEFEEYRAGIEKDGATGPGLEFSSHAAGAAVAITITADNPTPDLGVGDLIKVRLNGFGVPSSISGEHVFLRQAAERSAVAADVTVNGKVLTIEVADTDPSTGFGGLDAAYEIRIRQAAGITNPATAGVYHVELDDIDNTVSFGGEATTHHVRIDRSRKLSAGSGTSGSELTISGTGYNVGASAIFIENTDGSDWDGVSGVTYRPIGITEAEFDNAAIADPIVVATFLTAIYVTTAPTAETVYQIVFTDGFEYWQYTPASADGVTPVVVEGVRPVGNPLPRFRGRGPWGRAKRQRRGILADGDGGQ